MTDHDKNNAAFNEVADIEAQLVDIHRREVSKLLERLGHTLGNEDAAAELCSLLPDLEAGENGDLEAMGNFVRQIQTLIYNHETGNHIDYQTEHANALE